MKKRRLRTMKLRRLTESDFRTLGTCPDMPRPEWEKISEGQTVDFLVALAERTCPNDCIVRDLKGGAVPKIVGI